MVSVGRFPPIRKARLGNIGYKKTVIPTLLMPADDQRFAWPTGDLKFVTSPLVACISEGVSSPPKPRGVDP